MFLDFRYVPCYCYLVLKESDITHALYLPGLKRFSFCRNICVLFEESQSANAVYSMWQKKYTKRPTFHGKNA